MTTGLASPAMVAFTKRLNRSGRPPGVGRLDQFAESRISWPLEASRF